MFNQLRRTQFIKRFLSGDRDGRIGTPSSCRRRRHQRHWGVLPQQRLDQRESRLCSSYTELSRRLEASLGTWVELGPASSPDDEPLRPAAGPPAFCLELRWMLLTRPRLRQRFRASEAARQNVIGQTRRPHHRTSAPLMASPLIGSCPSLRILSSAWLDLQRYSQQSKWHVWRF